MPTWLIATICPVGYVTIAFATGWGIAYVQGRRAQGNSYVHIDMEVVVPLAIFWFLGVFWFAIPVFRSAFERGQNIEARRKTREVKRKAKAAQQEKHREFIELCKQNGWSPKQVAKNAKLAA